MDLGPHAAFIVLSYVAVGAVIAGLIAGLWLTGRRHAREHAALEARGLDVRGVSDNRRTPS